MVKSVDRVCYTREYAVTWKRAVQARMCNRARASAHVQARMCKRACASAHVQARTLIPPEMTFHYSSTTDHRPLIRHHRRRLIPHRRRLFSHHRRRLIRHHRRRHLRPP